MAIAIKAAIERAFMMCSFVLSPALRMIGGQPLPLCRRVVTGVPPDAASCLECRSNIVGGEQELLNSSVDIIVTEMLPPAYVRIPQDGLAHQPFGNRQREPAQQPR